MDPEITVTRWTLLPGIGAKVFKDHEELGRGLEFNVEGSGKYLRVWARHRDKPEKIYYLNIDSSKFPGGAGKIVNYIVSKLNPWLKEVRNSLLNESN